MGHHLQGASKQKIGGKYKFASETAQYRRSSLGPTFLTFHILRIMLKP